MSEVKLTQSGEKILDFIKKSPNKSIYEIAKDLQMHYSSVHGHIKILNISGLVVIKEDLENGRKVKRVKYNT